METEGKIELAKAKLKSIRAKTQPGDSNDDLDSSSDEGTDDDVKEKLAKEKATDDARKEEFEEENGKAAEKNLKVSAP